MQRQAMGARPLGPHRSSLAPALVLQNPSSCGTGGFSRRLLVHGAVQSTEGPASSAVDYPDPEAKFRRYGAHFGGGYKLGADWLEDVPRVRVRKTAERQRDSLLELAALNERLAGTQAHEARRKLEYLKMRRHNWEAIYHYITKRDAVATLAVIEEASRKVEEALSEEARERSSVSDLKDQLEALQQEVDNAHQKLHVTQARVEQNLDRIDELRAEAVSFERSRTLPSLERPVVAATRSAPASTSYSMASATPVAARAKQAWKQADARKQGLQSSLEMEDALRQFWYPAEFSSKLAADTLVPFEMFGEPWVLFRDAEGKPGCLRDECAHRACPLSLGKVVNGQVQCAYHGWEFGSDGACNKMPSTAFCRGVRVNALPCAEKDGFIWIWPGNGEPPAELPDFSLPPAGFDVHAEIMVDVPVEHGLLMENLLDLAHAPFTHTTTFARGWPVPDFVKFHASRMLSGNWDPYPIGMSFQPPCMVLSTIGLAQVGKVERGLRAEDCKKHLHQLHVCLPSKKGHTRLLYRMSLDFMGWVRHVPFIDLVWKRVAAQVLGEDLVLVKGQQERLMAGGNTWSNPVAYDKLAVRYRRWRNSVARGDTAAAAQQAALGVSVSAGELFAVTDGECSLDECGVEEGMQQQQQQPPLLAPGAGALDPLAVTPAADLAIPY